MPYANNKGAYQPAHARNLTNAIVVQCLDNAMPILGKSKISGLYLVSVAEQVCLSLTWSQTLENRFSHDKAQSDVIDVCY